MGISLDAQKPAGRVLHWPGKVVVGTRMSVQR